MFKLYNLKERILEVNGLKFKKLRIQENLQSLHKYFSHFKVVAQWLN